jgi:hypothetical protein
MTVSCSFLFSYSAEYSTIVVSIRSDIKFIFFPFYHILFFVGVYCFETIAQFVCCNDGLMQFFVLYSAE